MVYPVQILSYGLRHDLESYFLGSPRNGLGSRGVHAAQRCGSAPIRTAAFPGGCLGHSCSPALFNPGILEVMELTFQVVLKQYVELAR